MIIAARKNHVEFVKFLFEKGVNLDYKNADNQNCLDVAVINNQYSTAYFLVKNNMKLRTLSEYMNLLDPRLKEELENPMIVSEKTLFNLPQFFEHLTIMTDPADIPLFIFLKGGNNL